MAFIAYIFISPIHKDDKCKVTVDRVCTVTSELYTTLWLHHIFRWCLCVCECFAPPAHTQQRLEVIQLMSGQGWKCQSDGKVADGGKTKRLVLSSRCRYWSTYSRHCMILSESTWSWIDGIFNTARAYHTSFNPNNFQKINNEWNVKMSYFRHSSYCKP